MPIETGETRQTAPVLIRRATVMTAAGDRFDPGFVLMSEGEIAAVGEGRRTDPARGHGRRRRARQVRHAGDHRSALAHGRLPGARHRGARRRQRDDRSHHGGPARRALVLAAGRGARARRRRRRDDDRRAARAAGTSSAAAASSSTCCRSLGARAMRFPGAPEILKMACGENPKRVYGELKRAPSTRMGNLRALREAFTRARKYAHDWEDWAHAASRRRGLKDSKGDGERRRRAKPPDRDLALETLALVMRGDILVEWHCYQADDMLAALAGRRRVRLQGARVPPRARGLQDPRRARGPRGGHRHVGRLVGLQDGGLRRHPREPRARHRGGRARGGPLRFAHRRPDPQPGGGQGARRRDAPRA